MAQPLNLKIGMHAKCMQGQSSIEYVIAVAGLLIILLALYQVSIGMNSRLLLLQSQIEGERVAEQLGRAIEAVDYAGQGAKIIVRLYSSPAQYAIFNSTDIALMGVESPSAAFLRHLAVISNHSNISANQSVLIIYDYQGERVEGIG
jgi:hypothetical protein